jgi:hypothetical protein
MKSPTAATVEAVELLARVGTRVEVVVAAPSRVRFSVGMETLATLATLGILARKLARTEHLVVQADMRKPDKG